MSAQDPQEQRRKPEERRQKPAERRRTPDGRSAPDSTRRKPAQSQQRPVEARQRPTESRQKPVESRQKPVESRQKPVESRQKPVESRQRPAESRQKPGESLQKPAGRRVGADGSWQKPARAWRKPGEHRPAPGGLRQKPAERGPASDGSRQKPAERRQASDGFRQKPEQQRPAPDEQAASTRRLTAGERNEQRRQERRAVRRAEQSADPRARKPAGARGGAPAERGAAGGTGAGPQGGQPVSSGTGEERARKPRHRTGATGGQGPSGASEVRPAARTGGKGSSSRVHRHKAAVTDKREDGVYRAGFACFVGRPNAGKSTLTNAIVGQKIAITSSKPQTTRHVIRGVLHRPDAQLVLVDTPGLHRPRTLLGQRLNDLVHDTWSEVDVIGVCFPADEPVGRGDRFIASEVAELKGKIIAVVTKVDLVDPATLAQRLLDVAKLHDFAEIIPVSAVSGHQVEILTDVMVKLMPESPQLYPDDVLTDEPEQVLIAELIRESALEGVRDELPHSIAVMVEEMQVEGKHTKIYADLYVERSSQKSIVIGTRGERLKEVGSRARVAIEELLGTRIYLDLHVRVAKEWQRDPKQLRKLGF